jgi:hypothetical protein
MALNIFEPRYRLMVRRCMEGSRRFGMACVDRTHRLHEVRAHAAAWWAGALSAAAWWAGALSAALLRTSWFAAAQPAQRLAQRAPGTPCACAPCNTSCDAAAQVACEAEITECSALPDGRFYLEIVGRRRFQPLDPQEQVRRRTHAQLQGARRTGATAGPACDRRALMRACRGRNGQPGSTACFWVLLATPAVLLTVSPCLPPWATGWVPRGTCAIPQGRPSRPREPCGGRAACAMLPGRGCGGLAGRAPAVPGAGALLLDAAVETMGGEWGGLQSRQAVLARPLDPPCALLPCSQTRRGVAELLQRLGDKPTGGDAEELSFWAVSSAGSLGGRSRSGGHGCAAA